jgi:hypothetical protein
VATGRRGASRALRGGTTQGATPRRATRADWLEDPSGRERGTQRASKPEAGDARMATGDEAAKSDPAACVPIYGRSQTNKMTRPFTVCFERVGECRWLNARSAATRDARRLDGPELSPQHERPSKCRARDTSPGERRESATPWKSLPSLSFALSEWIKRAKVKGAVFRIGQTETGRARVDRKPSSISHATTSYVPRTTAWRASPSSPRASPPRLPLPAHASARARP